MMAGGPKQRWFVVAILIAIGLMIAAIVILAVLTTSRPDTGSPVEHDMDLRMGRGPGACASTAQAAAENCNAWRDAGGLLG